LVSLSGVLLIVPGCPEVDWAKVIFPHSSRDKRSKNFMVIFRKLCINYMLLLSSTKNVIGKGNGVRYKNLLK